MNMKEDVKQVKTTMEWINVNRMTPEPFVSVLCRMPGEKPFPTVHEGYITKDGIWVSNYFKREPGEVTHWAEMPTYPGDDFEGDTK